MKKIMWFLLIILLAGCSASSKPTIKSPQPNLEENMQADLPGWVHIIPPGMVVGIAPNTANKENSVDAACKMAAVFSNRNRSSILISKMGNRDAEDDLADVQVKFRMNVGDPKRAQKEYENLILIDEAKLHNYFIGLFAPVETEVGKLLNVKTTSGVPLWFQKGKLQDDEGVVTCHEIGSSADFVRAWEKAAENGRLRIAEYLEKHVQGLLASHNNNIDKYISVETAKNVDSFKILRSAVQVCYQDHLLSYKVYMEVQR